MINDLVLGTMYFGTRTDRATSFALLDRFVEAGGTTLDTANCYAFWASDTGHGGQSEALVGEWLRANPGLRERLTIATKVGVEPLDGGGVEGLGAETVRREAGRSLERLGVDRIDLYWAHAEDRRTPIEETTEALGELVTTGAVGRVGISNHPTWLVERSRAHARARGLEPASALQLTTSYVAPRPGAAVEGKDHRFGWVTDETIDYLERNDGIELWAYSPLVQGSLRPRRPTVPAGLRPPRHDGPPRGAHRRSRASSGWPAARSCWRGCCSARRRSAPSSGSARSSSSSRPSPRPGWTSTPGPVARLDQPA